MREIKFHAAVQNRINKDFDKIDKNYRVSIKKKRKTEKKERKRKKERKKGKKDEFSDKLTRGEGKREKRKEDSSGPE